MANRYDNRWYQDDSRWHLATYLDAQRAEVEAELARHRRSYEKRVTLTRRAGRIIKRRVVFTLA